MRRAAPLLALTLAVLAGCGSDDDSFPTDAPAETAPPVRTVEPPAQPLTRIEAIREAQSAVSQEAFRRDFSFAAADISAGCAPLDEIDGRPRFACRFRSPKDSCTGTVQIARLADGSNQVRDLDMDCEGPPNIGPDTSQPSG